MRVDGLIKDDGLTDSHVWLLVIPKAVVAEPALTTRVCAGGVEPDKLLNDKFVGVALSDAWP